ncbi:MAG: universal stress protein [Rhodothermales bacterium]|nr:universal stress protein [Rhodothermales bacterium]
MMQIKNILFPTDFSASSEKAFLFADPLVSKFKSRLHILHLISWHGRGVYSRSEYGLPISEQNRILKGIEADARQQISDLFKVDPDYYVQMVEESSKTAAEGIINYSNENDIDLIVIGSAGGREIYRHLVGGTLEKIIADAPVPVFAVGADAQPHQDFTKLLVPVDLSENSDSLLAVAADYAELFGARITIAHVVTPQDTTVIGGVGLDPMPAMKPVDMTLKREQVNDLADRVLKGRVEFDVQVVAGHPALEIEKMTQDGGCDLVVIASHGYKGFKRLFLGSTARHTVHHASCPVLVMNSNSLYQADDEGE